MASTDVIEVVTIEMHAQRFRGGPAPATRFDLNAGYAVEEDKLVHRIEVQATLLGEDESPIGSVRASMGIVFGIPVGTPSLSDAVLANTHPTALKILFPYLRETVQTLSARIGVTGVLLPLAVFTEAGDEPEPAALQPSPSPEQ